MSLCEGMLKDAEGCWACAGLAGRRTIQCREIRINGVHDYLCRVTERQTEGRSVGRSVGRMSKHIKKYNTKTVARARAQGYSWGGVGRI